MIYQHIIFLLCAFVTSLPFANGFAPVDCTVKRSSESAGTHIPLRAASHNDETPLIGSQTRRNLIQIPIQLAVIAQTIQAQAQPASAAAIGEKVKALTPEEAEEKFREGYKAINYLLDHYEEVCDGGGDNVRRYLGTIISNPPSGLVGIGKTMKALEDRADDFIEYTEMSEEVVKSINQADGSAYMAIFVTSSTSYTPPKKFFDDGLIEVKRCKKAMEEIAAMIHIKL